MNWNIVLLTLAIFVFLKGILLLAFPHFSRREGEKILRSHKIMKKVGIWDLIIALILVLIGINV